ncbi:MAG TPA: excinuclease ABC subunit UvrA, partial [Streptosporangiaceae bacterium]
MKNRLIVRGAREHNLRNVDLDLPREAMIVFTGLSGSGKSSLAFDTIFAEGQRRYVESLSAYARQFLGQLDKPDVDAIEGLAPAVAIDQKSGSRNPRSTVGTITEIYDHLRLLWARIGQPHCPVCGALISRQTPQQIVDELLDLPEGTRFYLLAPVAPDVQADGQDVFEDLRNKGYARVRVDGTVYPLHAAPVLDPAKRPSVEVVVDRLVVRDSSRARITDSVETALKLADGVVLAELVDRPADDPERERRFSEHLSCPNGHPVSLDDELEPRAFSFNSPQGACPVCGGLGTQMEADPALAVPDGSKPLSKGAVAPWATWQEREYFTRLLEAAAESGGFSLDTPWDELPEAARDAVLHGTGEQVRVSYRTRSGRDRTYRVRFEGVLPWIQRRYAEAESDSAREKFEGYMRAVPCPACGGARLRPEILAVTIAGASIADVAAMPVRESARWLSGLTLSPRDEQISARVRQEAGARLGFLTDVGLGYLALDRPAATLAGGEAQRIRLATQIGSGLSGVLYVLDEPSIGLHQRDNQQLIGTLTRLRDLGNTLIVVEHDEDTIRAADWVVDIGP